mmetsp:Transcript_2474/g.5663  ORF Transcript_2474/g.5663 Transcript_2474/m.5663 type:complete len:256 (-) Transcript_2474:80-847(-)
MCTTQPLCMEVAHHNDLIRCHLRRCILTSSGATQTQSVHSVKYVALAKALWTLLRSFTVQLRHRISVARPGIQLLSLDLISLTLTLSPAQFLLLVFLSKASPAEAPTLPPLFVVRLMTILSSRSRILLMARYTASQTKVCHPYKSFCGNSNGRLGKTLMRCSWYTSMKIKIASSSQIIWPLTRLGLWQSSKVGKKSMYSFLHHVPNKSTLSKSMILLFWLLVSLQLDVPSFYSEPCSFRQPAEGTTQLIVATGKI